MRVVKCPCCGEFIRDNPLWRGSRYDFNSDYMSWEDALKQPELSGATCFLENCSNFVPYEFEGNTYYKRGKGGKWFYRVPTEDFRVDTEKRKPACGKQLKLTSRAIKEKLIESE
jgi:hypothetical protein